MFLTRLDARAQSLKPVQTQTTTCGRGSPSFNEGLGRRCRVDFAFTHGKHGSVSPKTMTAVPTQSRDHFKMIPGGGTQPVDATPVPSAFEVHISYCKRCSAEVNSIKIVQAFKRENSVFSLSRWRTGSFQ